MPHLRAKHIFLYGDKPIFLLSLRMAAYGIAGGSSVAVVDGCNRFNVHFLSQFARERRLNIDDFLHRIYVSRGFTCYQMEQAIVYRLPSFLGTINSRTAMIFGLLDTFYDQQASLREVQQILHRVVGALREMKAEGISVLLVCRNLNVLPKERNELFTTLQAGVDTIYRLRSDGDVPKLFLEKGVIDDGANGTRPSPTLSTTRSQAGRSTAADFEKTTRSFLTIFSVLRNSTWRKIFTPCVRFRSKVLPYRLPSNSGN